MKENIGQQLIQARQARALSLEQAAQATRIRIHYLKAMEAGDFEALPSNAQARGFLRAYAGYLGLKAEPLLAELIEKETLPETPTAPRPGFPRRTAKRPAEFPSPAAASEQAETPAPAAPDENRSATIPAKTLISLQRKNVQPAVPPALAPKAPAPAPANRPAEFPPVESERGAAIFAEIGQRLQHQRELLGISLDDVVNYTHLRRHYLAALEAGNLAGLPSPVQGRGMLNNYAVFLGLDPEPLLLRFAEGLQARLADQQAARSQEQAIAQPRPARRRWQLPAPLRRFLSGDLLIGGLITVFLVGFVLWGAVRIFAMRSQQAPSPTAPSIADVLLATATPTATATPIPGATQEALGQVVTSGTPPAGGALPSQAGTADVSSTQALTTTIKGTAGPKQNVQIYITVRQRAWMQIKVDNKVEFQGRVLPNSAYSFAGEKQVEILTGNAAALQVFFGQQDMGVLGLFGEIVDQIYTANGIVSPTPSATPTITPTPRTTPTPRSSGTPALTSGTQSATSAPNGTPTIPALP